MEDARRIDVNLEAVFVAGYGEGWVVRGEKRFCTLDVALVLRENLPGRLESVYPILVGSTARHPLDSR